MIRVLALYIMVMFGILSGVSGLVGVENIHPNKLDLYNYVMFVCGVIVSSTSMYIMLIEGRND